MQKNATDLASVSLETQMYFMSYLFLQILWNKFYYFCYNSVYVYFLQIKDKDKQY